MITALYAVILAGMMMGLSFQVIKQRRIAKVAYADGGIDALKIARSAQSNAMDYIPITLLLMALVEQNGASVYWIHFAGILFVIGRGLHARAILNDRLSGRVLGMKLTFSVMLGLMALNLYYLPWSQLI